MNFEKQIEFDKIKDRWMGLAMTEWAKGQIQNATFLLSESELRKQIRDTTNGRKMMELLGMPPLQDVNEIKEILAISEKGGCLTPWQLARAEKAVAAFWRLKDYLGRGKINGNPLAYYEENLGLAEDLREEISRQIRNEAVDDYASGELHRVRGQLAKCQEQMKQKAEQVMRANPSCMADNYCTQRNGRVCVPVKKEYRQKIKGSLIGKSATGNTLFVEPSAVGKYYEEMQLLAIREEQEVHRILYTLTAMVAAAAPALQENIRLMEKLDFIFSKGKLSMDLGAVEPSINTGRRIVLKDARHPLMERDRNVPLQFTAGGGVRGVAVTGPNTGGKTVAIKTVMLNCLMAQCGLHVPCKEADICMNSSYFCDIGDGQDLAGNLSTFSAHMKNVLEILEGADKDSFIIMDELGSGTDPAEGMGIAIAVLEELRKSGANFLVTTHYPEVKEFAKEAEGMVNARMAFDKETLRPTYQMVIGEAGESCAFYIASRLGMPERILRTAVRAAYGDAAASQHPAAACIGLPGRHQLAGNGEGMAGGQYSGSITQGGGGNQAIPDSGLGQGALGAGRGQRIPEGGSKEPAECGKPSRNLLSKEGAARGTSGGTKILKAKALKHNLNSQPQYQVGDSVMVYPDKKIGIVCIPANEKGVLRVQMPNKKIWVNHKRVKLHVAAAELYPEDYDFSIVFDTVEQRKARHDMGRKYTEKTIQYEE